MLKARNFRAALWQIVLSKANCAAPIPNGWSLWSQMTVTAFDSRRVRVKMNSGMSASHDNAQLDLAYLLSDTLGNISTALEAVSYTSIPSSVI